jgi:hypothetical protein
MTSVAFGRARGVDGEGSSRKELKKNHRQLQVAELSRAQPRKYRGLPATQNQTVIVSSKIPQTKEAGRAERSNYAFALQLYRISGQ